MKRILWLAVSGAMLLSLVAAACAPAPVQEEEKKATVTEKEEVKEAAKEAAPKEVVATVSEKPKYGGTITLSGVPSSFAPIETC